MILAQHPLLQRWLVPPGVAQRTSMVPPPRIRGHFSFIDKRPVEKFLGFTCLIFSLAARHRKYYCDKFSFSIWQALN